MKLSAKSGFTLIEVVAALAISGIVGGFLVSFMVPHIKTYHWSYQMAESKYICGTLFDILESELRYGKDFMVLSDGSLRYTVVEEDGSEQIKNCPLSYDKYEFIPETVRIMISYRTSGRGEWVELTMSVYEESELLYQQSAFIRSFY